ncbi:MAG: hypothetical protein AAF483_31225 [Planctomycetota bacterium]
MRSVFFAYCLVFAASTLAQSGLGDDRRDSYAVEIAKSVWPEGISYDDVRDFSPDDTRQLIELLQNEDEKTHWVNAITIIGFAGNISDIEPLLQFMEQNSESAYKDFYTLRAVATVPFALGCIGYENDANFIRERLVSLSSAQAWRRSADKSSQGDSVALELAQASVIGLAMSGDVARTMMVVERMRATRSWDEGLNNMVLEIVEIVESEGLEGYYSNDPDDFDAEQVEEEQVDKDPSSSNARK